MACGQRPYRNVRMCPTSPFCAKELLTLPWRYPMGRASEGMWAHTIPKGPGWVRRGAAFPKGGQRQHCAFQWCGNGKAWRTVSIPYPSLGTNSEFPQTLAVCIVVLLFHTVIKDQSYLGCFCWSLFQTVQRELFVAWWISQGHSVSYAWTNCLRATAWKGWAYQHIVQGKVYSNSRAATAFTLLELANHFMATMCLRP